MARRRGPELPRRRSRSRRAFYGLVVLPVLMAIGTAGTLGVFLFATVPLPDDISYGTSRVLDREGNEIGSLSAQATREDVALEALPAHVPHAVMAAEDRSFYTHRGLSVRGTVRAMLANVRAGGVAEGGSTISQQYIKNAALDAERTFARKTKEAVLALKLERQYSKDEILGFYLNTIYWGRGAYGIEAAAQTYFGVGATELNANQSATLAGIIQAPSALDPTENPERADARRRYVLDGMIEQGWLTADEGRRLADEGLPETSGRSAPDQGPAAYYLDAVRRELTSALGEDVVYRGLTVHTELDVRMQEAAQATVSEALAQLPPSLAATQVSGALVTIDPQDGGVRALVGGPDFEQQQFNAAVTGQNQSGSAFKTFGLAAFLDEGNSPESRFPAPAEMEVEFDGSEPYEVANFGERGFGSQTVRQATLTSTNTVYVQMAAEVGPEAVKRMAVDAGVEDDADLDAVPSLVLGTADVSVLEMAQAYATFAGGGVRTRPRLVREVEDGRGTVIHRNEPDREETIDEDVAHAVSDVLADNVQRGTGTRAQIGRPAAGKTGTTQDSRDAWFAGYTPQLATAVWLGTLDDTSMGDVTGGSIPAGIWGDYMRQAMEGMEVLDFPDPELDLDVVDEAPQESEPEPQQEPVAPTCAEGQRPDPVTGECVDAEPTPEPSPVEPPVTEPSPAPEPPAPTRPTPPPPDGGADGDGDGGDRGDGGTTTGGGAGGASTDRTTTRTEQQNDQQPAA